MISSNFITWIFHPNVLMKIFGKVFKNKKILYSSLIQGISRDIKRFIKNAYKLHNSHNYGFDSSSIGHFPAMVCSISVEDSLNLVAH